MLITKMIDFEEHGDDRGTLISLEQMKNIPFDIRRVYYMYGTGAQVRRGFHAHKNLKQVLICVSGQCKILLDNGKEKTSVVLNSPSRGLLVEADMWREMYDFSEDAVLLVVASLLYDEEDYIRNYDEFLEYVNQKQGGNKGEN